MRAPLLQIRELTAVAFLALAAWQIAVPASAQDLLGEAPAADTSASAPEGEGQPQQQQLTQEDVKRMFTEAEQALKDKDFQKALGIYDQLVRAFKAAGMQAQVFLPVVYTGRGNAFAGLEDFESAKSDFDEALKENSAHMPALIARGKLYFEVGANDLAYADFLAAQEQNRQDPEVLFGMGKAMVLLGAGQQAIKPLEQVVEQDENNAEAHQLLAQAYSTIAKYDKANDEIQKAISLDPDNFENHFALAGILLREKKYKEAIDAVDASIQNYKPKRKDSDEPFAQGYLTKAAVLLEFAKEDPDPKTKTDAYEQALEECDKLIELAGDNPTYANLKAAGEFRRGVCLRLLGRYGDAIASLTESINLNPDLAEAYFRRGIVFYNMGEDDLAILDFRHAANIEYQDPRPKLWEGFAQAKKGEYLEAIRCYGLALADSDRYVPAYVNRGLAYMARGENDKALSDFNAALRLEPAEWTHYFKRGVVYERLGKNQQAADSFVSAIRLFDEYAPAYRHAADALDKLGHPDLAKEYRDKAAEVEAAQKKAAEEAAKKDAANQKSAETAPTP
ncbi:MAG: tetratricopeptide repeat protein [Pirellulales bacterium]